MNAVKEKQQAPEMVELKEIATMEVLKPTKPTADERIKRSEEFEILARRFEILNEKKNGLNKFLISDDGTQACTLTLKSAGKSFEINNNGVIKKLLITAKSELDSLIESTESEVLNFVI